MCKQSSWAPHIASHRVHMGHSKPEFDHNCRAWLIHGLTTTMAEPSKSSLFFGPNGRILRAFSGSGKASKTISLPNPHSHSGSESVGIVESFGWDLLVCWLLISILVAHLGTTPLPSLEMNMKRPIRDSTVARQRSITRDPALQSCSRNALPPAPHVLGFLSPRPPPLPRSRKAYIQGIHLNPFFNPVSVIQGSASLMVTEFWRSTYSPMKGGIKRRMRGSNGWYLCAGINLMARDGLPEGAVRCRSSGATRSTKYASDVIPDLQGLNASRSNTPDTHPTISLNCVLYILARQLGRYFAAWRKTSPPPMESDSRISERSLVTAQKDLALVRLHRKTAYSYENRACFKRWVAPFSFTFCVQNVLEALIPSVVMWLPGYIAQRLVSEHSRIWGT